MCSCRERMTWRAGLRIASVLWAGDLRSVKWRWLAKAALVRNQKLVDFRVAALRIVAGEAQRDLPPPNVLISQALFIAIMCVKCGCYRTGPQRDAAPGSILAGVMAFTSQAMGNNGVLPSTFAGSLCSPSARRKAANNIGGKSLPRFAARRRIPRQAAALKKYRCGTSPVSKMADNKHTPSPLRDGTLIPVHSDVLSVQDSVGPPIPEFPQPPKDGTKRFSSVNRQDTGDVLPDHPVGACFISKSKKGEGQVTARVCQALSESSDREGLAGGSADEKRELAVCTDLLLCDGGHVAKVREAPSLLDNSSREWRDFACPRALPAEWLPGDMDSANTIAN
jgi:hypothetical protein